MLDTLSKLLITLTTLGTILGIYFKIISTLLTESIKAKYKNIPGENSIFQVILKISAYIFWYLYILLIIIYVLWFSKNSSSLSDIIMPKEIVTNFYTIPIMIALMFTMIWTPMFFFDIKDRYIGRLEGNTDIYISKNKITLNNINKIILGFFLFIYLGNICIFISKNPIIHFENNIILVMRDYGASEFNELIKIIAMNIFFCTFLILALNMSEICELLYNKSKFVFNTGKPFECNCFLEYKEYYLVTDNSNIKYIKKSDVKEIEKILEEVSIKEMINEKRDKTLKGIVKKIFTCLSKIKKYKMHITIGFFIIFSIAFPGILWYQYKPSYSDWYGILASFIGGAIGGITTLIALSITVKQTREIQKDNQNYLQMQDRYKFIDTIIELVSKYATNIALYLSSWTKNERNNDNKTYTPIEVNRAIAVECLISLQIRLRNIESAKNLLDSLQKAHDLSTSEIGYNEFFNHLDSINYYCKKFCDDYLDETVNINKEEL